MSLDHVRFYMKVPIGDGQFTSGKIDYNHLPEVLGIADYDLAGLRALDIAANDGFWTFWAEGRNASEVMAIDVDSFEGYDWGWAGPDQSTVHRRTEDKNMPSQWAEAGAGFWALHRHLNSNAIRKAKSIYDLDPKVDGMFDLIFNFGLLYHLRHPLLSLDRARAVCRGTMILETHLVNGFDDLPVNLFYNRDELLTVTNWTGPTQSCMVNWLMNAGFPRVFSNRTNTKSPYARRIFVACVDDAHAVRYESNPGLVEFDQKYLDMTRRKTRALLTPPK